MSVRMTLKLQGAAQHDEIRAIMRVPSPRPGPRPSNVILTDIQSASEAPNRGPDSTRAPANTQPPPRRRGGSPMARL